MAALLTGCASLAVDQAEQARFQDMGCLLGCGCDNLPAPSRTCSTPWRPLSLSTSAAGTWTAATSGLRRRRANRPPGYDASHSGLAVTRTPGIRSREMICDTAPRLTLCATPGCARRRSSVDFGHAMEVNHGARGYWNRGCGLASGRVCLEYACSNSYQSDVHRGTAVHARRGLVAAEPRDLRHARNGSRNGSKIART